MRGSGAAISSRRLASFGLGLLLVFSLLVNVTVIRYIFLLRTHSNDGEVAHAPHAQRLLALRKPKTRVAAVGDNDDTDDGDEEEDDEEEEDNAGENEDGDGHHGDNNLEEKKTDDNSAAADTRILLKRRATVATTAAAAMATNMARTTTTAPNALATSTTTAPSSSPSRLAKVKKVDRRCESFTVAPNFDYRSSSNNDRLGHQDLHGDGPTACCVLCIEAGPVCGGWTSKGANDCWLKSGGPIAKPAAQVFDPSNLGACSTVVVEAAANSGGNAARHLVLVDTKASNGSAIPDPGCLVSGWRNEESIASPETQQQSAAPGPLRTASQPAHDSRGLTPTQLTAKMNRDSGTAADTAPGRSAQKAPEGYRFAYVWILGGSGDSRAYAQGIRASATVLRRKNAHLVDVLHDENCTTKFAAVVEYVLLVGAAPVSSSSSSSSGGSGGGGKRRGTSGSIEAEVAALTPLFDRVIRVERGGKDGRYNDHHLKFWLFGLHTGGPLIPIGLPGFSRVMYIEADYFVLRSLTHLFFRDFDGPPDEKEGRDSSSSINFVPTSRLHINLAKKNPEFEPVSNEQRRLMVAELQAAADFGNLPGGTGAGKGSSCTPVKGPASRRQSGGQSITWSQAQHLDRTGAAGNGKNADQTTAGLVGMAVAYWLRQPCFMAGGPILVQPSEHLFTLYGAPALDCDDSRMPLFPVGANKICGYDRKSVFGKICETETEMGYLNRIHSQPASRRRRKGGAPEPFDALQHLIPKTLHEIYTPLVGELVFQPPPNTDMTGYFTRNYFDKNVTRAVEAMFGVHYAGDLKPWKSHLPAFGVKMEWFHELIHRWEGLAAG